MSGFAEIMKEYKVGRELAQVIDEYLKETNDDRSMLYMTVSYIQEVAKKFEFVVGQELTLENARKAYDCLPPFVVSRADSNKWLVTTIEALRLGDPH